MLAFTGEVRALTITITVFACIPVGPALLQMFCSALDTSLGDPECISKPGDPGVGESVTHIQGLDMQGRGECKLVLDGISSCLEYPGSSLQVRIPSIMLINFRNEKYCRLWKGFPSQLFLETLGTIHC